MIRQNHESWINQLFLGENKFNTSEYDVKISDTKQQLTVLLIAR